METFATLCFALAMLHTFSVKQFQRLAKKFPKGTAGETTFHLLGEIEIAFLVWATVFLVFFAATQGPRSAIEYLKNCSFTEPAFVFVVMTVSATRPILRLAQQFIAHASRLLPFQKPIAFYITTLVVGPLLGSLITEPAAMTVTALILFDRFYSKEFSLKWKYATLALLFVNISIGGTLTPFAAPPVLMVAQKWNWDLAFMLTHFGWKAAIAIVASTLLVAWRFNKELAHTRWENPTSLVKIPVWISLTHLIFLALLVFNSHTFLAFTGVFLIFLVLFFITKKHQYPLQLRAGLFVALFLAGLVILGGPQRWWLEPILTQLNHLPLFLGSTALTAITDNAALTYLGAQVPTLSEASRYFLVAGAVTGGGLTVIANAPNFAGFSILQASFKVERLLERYDEGISPLPLLLHALPPTLIAALCFWFL